MSFLNKLFKHREKREVISFKEKLHHFQSLLSSNDEALKMMGNLSELLSSGKPFSKGEISDIYSDILANTLDVTKHLSDMCGGKYQLLTSKVRDISDKCSEFLAPGVFCPSMWDCEEPDCSDCKKNAYNRMINKDTAYSYTVDEIDSNHTREVGGKMSRLCEIHNKLSIPIPDGFCITSKFFEVFLAQGSLCRDIDQAISSIDFNDNVQVQKVSEAIQALIIDTPIPPFVEKIILDNYKRLSSKNGEPLISVRSSAVGEDDQQYSFAGLHYTALNVSKENLIDACFEVLISKYLPRSLVYRYLTGLRDVDMPMSIGCQQMIDSEISGVLFTKDPIGNRDGFIIHAVRGLGSKIVEGSVAPQEYTVDSESGEVLHFKPGNQKYKAVPRRSDGLKEIEISDEESKKPCLKENQIKIILDYAKKIEDYFHTPQDIEWTIDKNGKIYILQCRPMTVTNSIKGDHSEDISLDDAKLKYPVLVDKGACASPGVGTGKVFLLKRFKDFVKFPTGGILVVKKASPELTRVLHKASGLIADIGNTTGHLSIIARELGIPVLVNSENATEVLSDGMTVTLNAGRARVYLGHAKELIDKYESVSINKNIFIKSPMFRIWQDISKLVIPLNLNDPDSPKFTPENCKTLHDVTRFAHEYGIREMFSLYESTQYNDTHAYPLKFKVPLNIHIIDLGGGLKNVEGKKYVTPDDVVSKPFQALLKGMTTPGIRWAGPLPVDLKGFTNLLMSNVVDTNRGDRDLGSRSYAIISDCYVNFFSRLGYHFSRLDAYATHEINNNYINFNFHGGAADPIRKVRRAKIITNVLETLNFSVMLKNDHVLATIRKVPESSILELLQEIGRLMGAVRNVDVTLTSDEYIPKFVEAFLNGDSSPALKFTHKD